MNTRAIHTLALLLISGVATLTLSGCATNMQQADIETGPTMAQRYQAAMQESDGNSLNAVRQKIHSRRHALPVADTSNQSASQASINSQVDDTFPTLPNHNIVVYIYPHLAGADQMPVQGYYTAVPFYSEIHYAIPGETGGE